ncbi:MAG: endonuclease/exonuclease/phosphatase family protein [Opitutae bacterium]|nr:endonuclease/exonuclease/phosphatase family protein [Opitutae bacterium]
MRNPCRWPRWAAILFLLAAAPGAARAQTALQVLTFNLRYASASDGDNAWSHANQAPQRREVAVRVISHRNPDLIGFQEGEDAQLDYLAAQLPAYAFERQRPSGGGGAEYAAFAYRTNRLELLDRDVFSLGPAPGGGYWNNTPGTHFNPYVYFSGMGLAFPRLALWGRFRWRATGREFLFTTTHFDFNNDPQVGSARLIVDNIQARNDRMPASPLAIVAGDFNSTQADDDWKLFTGAYAHGGVVGDFTDSWWQVHGTWTDSGTLHGFAGGSQPASDRIDWILHRGGFTATQAVIVTDSALATNLTTHATRTQYPSDHYPVLASLQWPPAASDTDRDGLPDALELSRAGSLPADPDSDDDGLLDGQEDLNGNGSVDGGETDALASGDTQLPTDIRNHSMNGVRDYAAARIAEHGLELHASFDGRHLYVATQDAGEGSDHFVFVTTNPAASVSAPWAKSGQVAPWIAFLADENDSDFCGWFDASGSRITDLSLARAVTYFENGGRLEGVIDLAQILGAGFTNVFFIAAAPYGTADGGALVPAAQVPAGNGDGHLTGPGEFARLAPGDADADGLNDSADPDADGDGLNDAWAARLGLSGGGGDDDFDGASNLQEYRAGTHPTDPASVFRLVGLTSTGVLSTAVHGHAYVLEISTNRSSWSAIATNDAPADFPESTLHTPWLPASSAWLRLRLAP